MNIETFIIFQGHAIGRAEPLARPRPVRGRRARREFPLGTTLRFHRTRGG